MTKVPSWNDIPWDEQAEPVEKADQFDRQYAENAEKNGNREGDQK